MSVGVADAIRVHMRYNSLVRVNLVVKASAAILGGALRYFLEH